MAQLPNTPRNSRRLISASGSGDSTLSEEHLDSGRNPTSPALPRRSPVSTPGQLAPSLQGVSDRRECRPSPKVCEQKLEFAAGTRVVLRFSALAPTSCTDGSTLPKPLNQTLAQLAPDPMLGGCQRLGWDHICATRGTAKQVGRRS